METKTVQEVKKIYTEITENVTKYIVHYRGVDIIFDDYNTAAKAERAKEGLVIKPIDDTKHHFYVHLPEGVSLMEVEEVLRTYVKSVYKRYIYIYRKYETLTGDLLYYDYDIEDEDGNIIQRNGFYRIQDKIAELSKVIERYKVMIDK